MEERRGRSDLGSARVVYQPSVERPFRKKQLERGSESLGGWTGSADHYRGSCGVDKSLALYQTRPPAPQGLPSGTTAPAESHTGHLGWGCLVNYKVCEGRKSF